MPIFDLPLLGDGHGSYRIQIIGNSGTGKTTLGAYLSEKLNLPHTSLDYVAWKPGWQRLPDDQFKENISALMAQDARGWVMDGNYTSSLESFIPDNATDIIWLDPPLWYYLPRLVWRTLRRILGFTSSCAEGCEETWAEIFSKQGLVWYCITRHDVVRTRYTPWLSRMGVQVGGKMRRLDESRGELAEWKDALERDIRQT